MRQKRRWPKPRRANVQALYRWVERGYEKGLGAPEELSTACLEKIRRERASRDLTHEEVWYVHTFGDPTDWLGAWFGLSATAVRKLQRGPNEGKSWTKAQLAKLAPLFATEIQKRKKAA